MTASLVAAMARDIVRREGGFVDDPADLGGATQHGVSLRYARRLGLDLDHDGDTDKDDIRLVTPDQAAELYVRDFFEEPGLDQLPEPLQACLFDFAVNAGPARAIMCLQDVLSEVAYAAPDLGLIPLAADGRIGPKTRESCRRAHGAMGPWLVNAIVEARIAYYRQLAKADPARKKFLAGWVNRANEFRLALPEKAS
jgi:lysozyme family protein